MKNRNIKFWLGIAAIALVFAMMAGGCDGIIFGNEEEGEGTVGLSFIAVIANGSATETTTELTLIFNAEFTELSANDISLSGVNGVIKGTLRNSGTAYTLPISGFSAGGQLTVKVTKKGYTISGATKTVTIYYDGGDGPGGGDVSLGNTLTISNAQVYSVNWDYSPPRFSSYNGTVSNLNYIYSRDDDDYTPLSDLIEGNPSVTLKNGKLNITLGKPKNSSLEYFNASNMPEGITVSRTDAKTFTINRLYNRDDDYVMQGQFEGNEDNSVMYVYADKDLNVTGQTTTTQYGVTYTGIYAVYFKAGWNSVYTTRSQTGTNAYQTTVKTGTPPAAFRWVINPHRGSGGGSDDVLDTPTLTASPSGTVTAGQSVYLSWNSITGATGYSIYGFIIIDGNPIQWVSEDTTSTSYFLDTTGLAGYTFRFTVGAYNANGGSASSNVVSVTVTGGSGGTTQTPAASDYTIGNLTQTAGSVTAVTITPKSGKSSGAITIKYAGSTTIPQTAGTYAVTFDVAATSGWNAKTGLSAGTLTVTSGGGSGDDRYVGTRWSATINNNNTTLTASLNFGIGGNNNWSYYVIENRNSSLWKEVTGTYTVVGNKVIATQEEGFTVEYTIVRDTLVRYAGDSTYLHYEYNSDGSDIVYRKTVKLDSVTQNGSNTQSTTQLTLTFDQPIIGLSANDITLTGVSGVIKGTLSGSGTTYTLPISGFTRSDPLTVAVATSDYIISGSPKTVNIYYNLDDDNPITIEFNNNVPGLSSEEINKIAREIEEVYNNNIAGFKDVITKDIKDHKYFSWCVDFQDVGADNYGITQVINKKLHIRLGQELYNSFSEDRNTRLNQLGSGLKTLALNAQLISLGKEYTETMSNEQLAISNEQLAMSNAPCLTPRKRSVAGKRATLDMG
jgi:hypothetical protein